MSIFATESIQIRCDACGRVLQTVSANEAITGTSTIVCAACQAKRITPVPSWTEAWGYER